MKNNTVHLADKKQLSKNKVLFVATFIATIFQVGWLILEMLGYQSVLFEMTAIYLLVLVTYAIQNRVLKWGNSIYKTRRGELFVYFFWMLTFIIYTLYILGLVTNVPDQLNVTFSGVTIIFFGTEIIKLIGRMLQEK